MTGQAGPDHTRLSDTLTDVARYVHAVPLVSDDGAFGGPLSVAVAQAQELQRRGHEVTLVGGHKGPKRPPAIVEGVPAKLWPVLQAVPASGFSGLIALGLKAWLKDQIHEQAVDLVHLHSGRHLVTLRVASCLRRTRVPYVVQTHGMIPATRRPTARLLDRFGTKSLITGAGRVLVLTTNEESELRAQFGSEAQLQLVTNGVRVLESRVSAPGNLELLFLGRLHRRKRPETLVDAVAILRKRGLRVPVTFVGPDEGSRPAVDARIRHHHLEDQISVEMPLSHDTVLHRLRQATVLVLPSVNEPFPMTLLEAMSVGTAVVCTTSCGLAPLLLDYDAGGVVEPNAHALADELGRLLTDEQLMAERIVNGYRLLEERLSVGAVVDQLENIYSEVAAR